MPKISAAFDARLLDLKPHERVRAIVLLDTASGKLGSVSPRSRAAREAAVAARREALKPVLSELDHILQASGGQRLAPEVEALGAVPVETTAAGARELAAQDFVKAILEDQPISAFPEPWQRLRSDAY
jgi:hypothetical protein